jgi:hypothetical protein
MAFDMAKYNQMHRDLISYCHDESIAEAQQAADEAAAPGDEWLRQFHQKRADALRAMPMPWDLDPAKWAVGPVGEGSAR